MIKMMVNRGCALLKNIQFLFHRKPRGPEVPTQHQTLQPFSINYLHDNPGSRYYAKILGRGPSSNKGKTCGRGIKGHWARTGGGPHVRFEGGQTPLQKRLPKYGRVIQKRPRQFLNPVNLQQIDYYVKRGALNPKEIITIKTLHDLGIVKDTRFGVKILGRGADRITYPINLEVTDASKTTIDYVIKQGGSVKLIHRTPLKLRQHLHPQRFPIPLLEPITPFWKIKKLKRKEQDRGVQIQYPKPKWQLQQLKQLQEGQIKKQPQVKKFIFPVPIVENSGKIRKRKAKIYRKITYNLPS